MHQNGFSTLEAVSKSPPGDGGLGYCQVHSQLLGDETISTGFAEDFWKFVNKPLGSLQLLENEEAE